MARAKAEALAPVKYPEVYEMCKAGLSDKDVAERLGLKKGTFRRLRGRDPVLDSLVLEGRKHANPKSGETYEQYLYGHLDPKAKAHWDRIMAVWRMPVKDVDQRRKKDRMLTEILKGTKNASKNTRQGLFVHALIKTGFNATKASMISGVPYRTYMVWAKEDPHFKHLLDELEWHRDNMLEAAFYKLVKAGNPAVVLHGVKSRLANRGYASKVQFEGNMKHTHEEKVKFEDLGLDLDTQKKILKAYDKQEAQEQLALQAHDPDVIEGEIVSVKPGKRRKPGSKR